MDDISTSIRSPHAVLNLETRFLKAKKIEALLNINNLEEEIRLLEVGTGSGGIANYFAMHSRKKTIVDAIDVIDSRLVSEGYNFQLVNGISLPFEDDTFDVVITNHVIEHVGLYQEQRMHVREVSRVLKKTGMGYLAVPNRWMLIEPHYKLIFLSWLPKVLRTPYLRLRGAGDFYDCEPLEKFEIEKIFSDSGLNFNNKCAEALKLTFMLEKPDRLSTKFITALPNFVYKFFSGIIPTLIYTFNRK